MSEFDVEKVFESRAQPIGSAGSDLVARVRDGAIPRAAALLKKALDPVDDSLFGFSEKSDTPMARVQFLDAMRNMRLKQPDMERVFREELANRFAEFSRGRGRPPAIATEVAEPGGLSLVDDNELEETLAINGMAAKAASRYSSALYALNQRFAAVVGAKEVTDTANPIGPHALCAALKVALREINAEITVKLVILKLFDRHVASDLDPLYDEANRLLAEAGVLPHIKYIVVTRPRSEVPFVATNATAAGEPVAAAAAMAGTGVASAAAEEMMSTFASLLANRRRMEHDGEGRRAAGPSLSATDLIAALTLLQTEMAHADPTVSRPSSPLEAVERVKRDLIEQLRKFGINRPDQRVARADEDAIDLASMLFQFVVQDRNLPAEIQALLCRLQIPYVRVAIKDKHLFAQKDHPARKLLNTLAMASVSWSMEADREGRFLKALDDTVERVIREYDDDFAVFDQIHRDFDAFLTQQRKRAEVAEIRTAETARGREKLAQARRYALQAVNSRIGHCQLPTLARDLLLHPWTNYLVLTHLRQGTESREWQSAINFVDAVVWSTLPKTDPQEYARMRTLIPQMQDYVRRGLGMVGFAEPEADRLVTGLAALIESLHERQTTPESASAVAEAERALEAVGTQQMPAALQGDDDDDDDDLASTEISLPDDDEFLLRARAMKVGTWVEFVGPQNSHERAKLSWISPISARFLFVNRKGLKVAERNLYMLANELRGGTAVILEVAPIFDRALDAIMNRLRQEHTHAAGPQRGESENRDERHELRGRPA